MNLKKYKKFLPVLLLIVITFLGYRLRFNKVFKTTIYNGDEGRDYLKAYQIWHGDLTLLGPAISTVRFYLPPTWYYLISIPLKIGKWNIGAPLFSVILVHTVTIPLTYLLGKETTQNKIGGLISASLYAFSPYMIKASRLTGNHVLIPPLVTTYLFFLVKYLKGNKKVNLLISSAVLGLTFSFHFSIVILILFHLGLFAINWLKNKKINFSFFLVNSVLLFVWWLPIAVFDLRHNFINFKGFWWYITKGNVNDLRQEIGQGQWSIINNLKAGFKILENNLQIGTTPPWLYLAGSILGWGAVISKNKINKQTKKISLTLLSFIGLFITNFLFYKGYTAYHFFFALFPFYVLLITIGLTALIKKHFSFLLIFVALIFPYHLFSSQAYADNPQRVEKVGAAANIITFDLNKMPEKEKYSIFLKKKQDYWALAKEYKYLVETKTDEHLVPDDHYGQADVLYVVAEIDVQDPLKIGNVEVKDFNPRQVIWEKEVEDYKVFKLK